MRRFLSILIICLLLVGTASSAFAAVVDENGNDGVIVAQLTEGTAYAAQNMSILRNAFESAQPGVPLTVQIASPGTYYVGDGARAWRLRSNTAFDLNGATLIRYGSQGNLIQNADYSGDNASIGGYALSENITVKNGTMDGAGDTGSKMNLCNLGHAKNIRLENMNFKNGNSHLVEFSGCRDSIVTGCTFSGYCPGTSDAVEALQLDISDNDVSKTSWNGIYYSDSTVCRNITVENCSFYDFPSGVGNHKGILGNHNTGIVIKNNRFLNSMNTSQPAVWSYDFDNSEISGNTIKGNYSGGVYLSACRNTVVKDNVVSLKGVGLYVTVGNSYVRGGEKDVRKDEYCYNCTVTGNTVTSSGSNIGACVYSGSGVSEFSGNTITAGGDIGAAFTSKSKVTNIKNNTVKAPNGIGMLFATEAQIGEVSGNSVTAKSIAMQISSSAVVTSVKNNPLITSSTDAGVFVSGATAKAISGNTVKNCSSDGICVSGTGVTSAVDSNTVTGCGGYGIRVNNSALTISFKSNKLSNNKAGAYKVNAKIKTANVAAPKITSIANVYGGVKLAWEKKSGAAKYRVFYKNGSSWKKLVDTASASYVDKTVASGKTRAYTVRCMDKNGSFISSYNTAGWKITYIASPALPTLTNTKKGVQIAIKKPAGATYIRIFRKTGSGKWVKLADTTAKSYLDKSAKKGVKYTYTLRCVNKSGKVLSAYNTAGRAIICKR